MEYANTIWNDIHAAVQLSTYKRGEASEYHAIIHVEPLADLFAKQLERITEAESRTKALLPEAKVVMKRYFVSDATNQAPLIINDKETAVSIIQQAPLDGSKVALWIYLVDKVDVRQSEGFTIMQHGNYQHLWMMGMHHGEGTSSEQTTRLLECYEKALSSQGATLQANCIRTWFFVRDVDTQYDGLVTARKDNFIAQGLNAGTHYIASTGIQGLPADPKSIIQLGTYALKGFEPCQQRYVKALSHLNPTIEYGVTFERGTVMEYGDRAHCFISGTASINNKGEVMHVGDIKKQTERMWENVEKLLEEGNFSGDDIAQIIVYLRDAADYNMVNKMFRVRYPKVPYVITLAPVCRPEWLIEMECIAITDRMNLEYSNF